MRRGYIPSNFAHTTLCSSVTPVSFQGVSCYDLCLVLLALPSVMGLFPSRVLQCVTVMDISSFQLHLKLSLESNFNLEQLRSIDEIASLIDSVDSRIAPQREI